MGTVPVAEMGTVPFFDTACSSACASTGCTKAVRTSRACLITCYGVFGCAGCAGAGAPAFGAGCAPAFGAGCAGVGCAPAFGAAPAFGCAGCAPAFGCGAG